MTHTVFGFVTITEIIATLKLNEEREAAAILGILPPQCKVYHTRYNIPSAILIISSAGGKLKEMQVIFYEK